VPALDDLVAAAGLLALLAVAYRHPPRWVEASVSVGVALGVMATGLLSERQVRTALLELAPVVVFLMTILVVADVCHRAGLFTALGSRLRAGGPHRLLTTTFLLGAATTAALSLDATVVLLTPVAVSAALVNRTSPRPAAYACLRMANSASLLLPVSNLTNLLALPDLDVDFLGFARVMAPVLVVVLVVEYVGLRVLFRDDLAARPSTPPATEATPLPVVPSLLVSLMLVGFAATSPLELDPFWVSGATAGVLAVWARRQGLLVAGDVVRSTHVEFALLVLSLGVVVAALGAGFLGDALQPHVPSSTSFLSLLAIAALATLLANVLTNLSATLLLVPLVAPLGDVGVFAALIGLNVGSGLTLSGSLANLLWRRTLAADGRRVSLGEFHRVSLLLTPPSVLAATATLWLL